MIALVMAKEKAKAQTFNLLKGSRGYLTFNSNTLIELSGKINHR